MRQFIVSLIIFILMVGVYTSLNGVFHFSKAGTGLSGIAKFFGLENSTSSKTSSDNSGQSTNPIPVSSPPPETTLKPIVQPPPGFSVEQLSSYYKQVRINYVGRGRFNNSSFVDQFSLRSEYGNPSQINISGWQIKPNKNEAVIIPRAIADFNPVRNWQESDLIVGPNQTIYFYRAASPIGRNFRLNKCTGYLNNLYQFNPSLPNDCPYIDRSEIVAFSGKCQNVVTSLGNCRFPSNGQLNSPEVVNDSACRTYLDTLNYGGCYNRYRQNADFFLNEWRVWLDKNISFDPEHDRLLLLDTRGLLVDEYIY